VRRKLPTKGNRNQSVPRSHIKSKLCYNKSICAVSGGWEVLPISKQEKRYHLAGWLLFLACAIFFIAQSLTDNNMLGLSGSIIFLAGCIAFLIPLLGNWRQ